MKITLEHADLTEPEIIIRGQPESAQVRNLIELLSGKQQKMFFFKNEYEYIFDMSDVSYFETNGSKVIAHIENNIYETRLKLYEIESTCNGNAICDMAVCVGCLRGGKHRL